MTDNINARHVDIDKIETEEWLDALESVITVSYTHLTLPTIYSV